jgi:anti-anti-sigma factor
LNIQPAHYPSTGVITVPQLNVALVPAPDQVVVRLTGEADLSTTSLLTDALTQAAGLGTESVVVDVAAARFWDCSSLHALATFTADLARAGRRCRIVGATAATRRLVVLADFATILVLDGPVHLPGVAPAAAATPRPPLTRPDRTTAAVAAVERRRSPVPAHPAPGRRRAEPAVATRGVIATRRWR